MIRRLVQRLRCDGRDSGQAVIELIAYTMAVALVAVACVQGIYVVQGVSAAQQAARDGARASSKGGSCDSAIRAQLPSWARLQSSSCSGGQASVTVQIPIMLGERTLSTVSVTREAVMPDLSTTGSGAG
ncbi:MAG: hypothetical protein FWH11_07910 [Micrococcales bacterium]|nr:hypothetical protein [Micrococcales bacterium]